MEEMLLLLQELISRLSKQTPLFFLIVFTAQLLLLHQLKLLVKLAHDQAYGMLHKHTLRLSDTVKLIAEKHSLTFTSGLMKILGEAMDFQRRMNQFGSHRD
jgi:hypothetical protein